MQGTMTLQVHCRTLTATSASSLALHWPYGAAAHGNNLSSLPSMSTAIQHQFSWISSTINLAWKAGNAKN